MKICRTRADIPLFLTTQDVATILGISDASAKTRFRAGDIKSFKVGSDWRCEREDLFDYIDTQKVRVLPCLQE